MAIPPVTSGQGPREPSRGKTPSKELKNLTEKTKGAATSHMKIVDYWDGKKHTISEQPSGKTCSKIAWDNMLHIKPY